MAAPRFSVFRDRDLEVLKTIKSILKLDRKTRSVEQKKMLVKYF